MSLHPIKAIAEPDTAETKEMSSTSPSSPVTDFILARMPSYAR